jgi:hypothetical protein
LNTDLSLFILAVPLAKQIAEAFPLLSPENPTLVAAVTPKKRYSQLSYQFACGGG